MDLNEIAIFIKVIQSGSFTAAAASLGLPNSTVSHKISSLEKRLGVTLIQRTTRRLNITAAGQAYYDRCLVGLEELKSAEAELATVQAEPRGRLRITAPLDLAATVLPGIVSQYQKKFPKVAIDFVLSDKRINLLSESIDLAIRTGQLEDSTLIAKKIGTTYFELVASRNYLKSRGNPGHPRELSSHDCLQYAALGNEWKLVSSRGSVSVKVPGKIVINHFEMIRSMALNHGGVAFLPVPFVWPDIRAGKLMRVLPEWRSSLSPVHFVYPAQRFVTPKLSSFIEHAGKALKEYFADFDT